MEQSYIASIREKTRLAKIQRDQDIIDCIKNLIEKKALLGRSSIIFNRSVVVNGATMNDLERSKAFDQLHSEGFTITPCIPSSSYGAGWKISWEIIADDARDASSGSSSIQEPSHQTPGLCFLDRL